MNKLEEQFKEIIVNIHRNMPPAIETIKQCAETTEQECVAFKKFCDKSFLIRTDEEMYQLYQKAKNENTKPQKL